MASNRIISPAVSNNFFRPIDNAFLVLFRAVFGLLITAECWGAIATGWVKRAFIDPRYTFAFIDFSDWLQPLPGDGMYFYFVVMGGLGVCIALGYQYRWVMPAFALMWAGVYLMQKTHYNNHYYLLMLMGFCMSFVPANTRFSLDVRQNPSIGVNTCPNWCRWLFLTLMILVYTYGGVAKIHENWFSLEAIASLMLSKRDYWLVGELLQQKWMHAFLAYGGVLFDLSISPLLLWKRSRRWAFYALLFFHLLNAAVFQVGIFPFLGIAMCLFFYPPQTLAHWVPSVPVADVSDQIHSGWKKGVVLTTLSVFLLIQTLLPLRHHLFAGNVNWTNEGHRLSWRMMLRTRAGSIDLVTQLPGEQAVPLDLSQYLTAKQERKVATHPDMLWQFVQKVKDDFERQGKTEVEIYVTKSRMSLNNAPYRPLYQTGVNLAEVPWEPFQSSHWVLR